MKKLAQFYKALGDETRLKIVEMLLGCELCVCDIIDAFNMSQPAISHHLKILKNAGVVIDSKEGKWIYYRLNPEQFASIDMFWNKIKQDVDKRERREPCSPNRL